MVRQTLQKFVFYRYRFVVAYVLFSISLAAVLIVAGLYLPGGLSDAEMRSAIISDGLAPGNLFSLQPDELLYLPYRLLQAGSFALFGFSTLSIKLPSLVLGFASAIALLYLLNLWYRRNVAIVAATIAVTTSQFVLASQAGQSGITYIFLTTMTLIAASMIARKSAYAALWVITGFILSAVSLYMPLNIYVLIALVVTMLVHPHARYVVLKQSSKLVLTIGMILFAVIISPLILGIMNDPSILLKLIGVPDDFSAIGANAVALFNQYFNLARPTSGAVLTPVYGLGLMLLLLIGLYRLVSTKYTAKSYLLSVWLVLLLPLICLNPEFVSITFVPVVLLIALAIDYLILSWYRLFPLNPYARILGLLPLTVLVGGLIISSIDRFVYGFHYDRNVFASYSYDLGLLDKRMGTLEGDNSLVRLYVTEEHAKFFSVYAKHQQHVPLLEVRSDPLQTGAPGVFIAEGSIGRSSGIVPEDVIVSRASTDADRFYLYKND